jgi:hypothetical protein
MDYELRIVVEKVVVSSQEVVQRDRYVAWVGIKAGAARARTPILCAVDAKGVEMDVTPGEDDLQRVMERGKRPVAVEEDTAPDQGADTLYDHAKLIDVR